MIGNVIAALLLGVGLFFMVVAAVGFIRLKDVFCRLHVTGVLDTLGAPVVLLGAAVYAGATLTAGKLLLAIAFLFVTSPLVGHLLSRAALEAGYEPEAGGRGPKVRRSGVHDAPPHPEARDQSSEVRSQRPGTRERKA